MNERLDATEIEQLKGWAISLAANGNDELRAAGKAILLLIEEIESSRVEGDGEAPVKRSQQEASADVDDLGEATMDRTLRSRLSRIRHRSSTERQSPLNGCAVQPVSGHLPRRWSREGRLKPIEERSLRCLQSSACLVEIEPFDAVDLGECLDGA